MHAPDTQSKFHEFARAKGEVYVWISSMGLTVGLAMVIFLLGLVLSNGLAVFWVKPIAEFQLNKIVSVPGTEPVLAGEIIKEQTKRAQEDIKQPEREYQLFVGNRDTYGFSFKYLGTDQIKSITYPEKIAVIERIEYGDAIGYPSLIKMANGREVPVTDKTFASTLAQLVDISNQRRNEVERIEKIQIGRINTQLNDLRLRQRQLARSDKENSMESGRIASQIQTLEADYEKLASRAKELRTEQIKDVLMLHLVSGQDLAIPFGKIIYYFYPNQLDYWSKWKMFFHNFWAFLSQDPREANTEGGVFPAIFGTFAMTLLMSIAVVPFGVLAAIYLREYAVQGFFVRAVRIAVNNLAGVPSIVFGVFGLGFFVYFVGGTIDQLFFSDKLPTPTFGTGGILWAATTLALMTVPVVIVATEEALAAVPRGMHEGSLACGASKWQTIQRVVLPAAAPGILTGLILAMARGAGEVAPLMLVGVVKLAPSLPIDGEFPFIHLERKFMHLGFHIYDLGFQSPDSEAAKPMVFATTLLLILLVVILNLAAIIIREKLRKKYAAGVF